MKKVVVLDDAVEDIEKARDFYDELEEGIGDYFSDSILSEFERLGLFHGAHSKHFSFYRMLSGRFPFGIYYRETRLAVEVFAVLDLRRDPSWLRGELSARDS